MDYPKSNAQALDLTSDNKFSAGDMQAGIPASIIPASWANLLTDELLSVIVGAGLTPNENQTDQLKLAIQKLLDKPKNEIEYVITSAGLTLDNNIYTQLFDAINSLAKQQHLLFSSSGGAISGTLTDNCNNFDNILFTLYEDKYHRTRTSAGSTGFQARYTNTTFGFDIKTEIVTTVTITGNTFSVTAERKFYRDSNSDGATPNWDLQSTSSTTVPYQHKVVQIIGEKF